MVEETYFTAEAARGAFLGYLKRRKSAGTAKQYGRYLAIFSEWAGERPLGEITARQIEIDYLGGWHEQWEARNGKPPSANTQRNHIQALRSFFGWLDRFDMLLDGDGKPARNPMSKIESPKVRRVVKQWLTPEEADDLLASCQSPREQIVTWFLRFTGIRWGEAMALRQKDVDLAVGLIAVTESKTDNGIRRVPIFPELRPIIMRWYRYLEDHGLRDPNGPFFTTRHRKPITEQQAFVLLRRVSARGGVPPCSPHTLRRTFGSHLINQGVRLEVISKLLGHGSTTVTEQAYAELLSSTIAREVLEAVS